MEQSVPYAERKDMMRAIERQRGGRTLVCFFNFDRASEPALSGLSTSFAADVKEALFRVLKESPTRNGVDLCIYTRGGDTNSVWPLVSLIREFDPDFQVIVPFRCHSSGTLVALGAKTIVLGPLSELSPIDPTTGNQFNPQDPAQTNNPRARLGISVEDVRAFRTFVNEQFNGFGADEKALTPDLLKPFLERLSEIVHPLALGNVQRVLLQIEQLAENLLLLHPTNGEKCREIIRSLTTKFYSHLHMINRHEAKSILGSRVKFASARLSTALDNLLREYELNFSLRKTFYLTNYLKDQEKADVRFIGGVVESATWSYLFETKAVITQRTQAPPNVQVQIPPGQRMPLVAGLPREINVEIQEQGWVRNESPKGVTK